MFLRMGARRQYVNKNHFDLILGVRPWGVLSLSNYVRFVRYVLSQGPSQGSRVWKDVNRLGTRDWNLMPYSSLVITGGQKHTHTHTHVEVLVPTVIKELSH